MQNRKNLGEHMKPWEQYIKPYHIYGNLYFAGSRCGSTHLINSHDGLILIDSGYPQTLYLLLENIRELGFDPHNIRHIIHSHGHYDHIGATRALIEMYHPKTYLGRKDMDYATGVRDLTWAKELGYRFEETFYPDVLLEDGDTFQIGGVDFYFMATPGHTEGTMSIFFRMDGQQGLKRCGMFGGAGFNSLSENFLDKYGLPHSLRDDFVKSLERADKEDVDIHLGNHVDGNRMFEKLAMREMNGENGDNPFIDENCWHNFIHQTLERFLKS
ncbi:MAG: MBL fold metallo-hydrolase [Eubacteriales bacterium]